MLDFAYNSSYLKSRNKTILIQGQFRQKVSKISKNKLGVVIHNCNPSYMTVRGRRIPVRS
jgi:hypothetical protein